MRRQMATVAGGVAFVLLTNCIKLHTTSNRRFAVVVIDFIFSFIALMMTDLMPNTKASFKTLNAT